MERRYEPMLLQKTDTLPTGEGWIFEPKLDGYRTIAYRSMERIMLMSRSGNQLTGKWAIPIITQLPDALGDHTAVLDAESIGIIEGQHSHNTVRKRGAALALMVFDILELDGERLIYKPWSERRHILESAVQPQRNIHICPYDEDGEAMEEATRELGYEGMVIKRKRSIYKPGHRSADWLKLKYPPHPASQHGS